MNKHGISKKSLFCAILICITFIMWLIFTVIHLSNYNYLYPEFTDSTLFFARTLTNLILPLIPIVISIIMLIKQKYGMSTICGILFLPILVISFVRGAAEILYCPSICSYTNNSSNFGMYDERLDIALTLNPVEYFPSSIPENINDLQYCYFYECASDDTVYIAISWKYEDKADFMVAVSEFARKDNNTENEVLLFMDSYYKNAIYIDEESLCVAYVIASSEKNTPVTMQEVFSIFKEGKEMLSNR